MSGEAVKAGLPVMLCFEIKHFNWPFGQFFFALEYASL